MTWMVGECHRQCGHDLLTLTVGNEECRRQCGHHWMTLMAAGDDCVDSRHPVAAAEDGLYHSHRLNRHKHRHKQLRPRRLNVTIYCISTNNIHIILHSYTLSYFREICCSYKI